MKGPKGKGERGTNIILLPDDGDGCWQNEFLSDICGIFRVLGKAEKGATVCV